MVLSEEMRSFLIVTLCQHSLNTLAFPYNKNSHRLPSFLVFSQHTLKYVKERQKFWCSVVVYHLRKYKQRKAGTLPEMNLKQKTIRSDETKGKGK